MLQILLVDDHEHLVESLAQSIPWSKLNIHHVHKAYSGAAALSILETYPISIVITDIRMHEMSGLELVKKINNKWKRVKCILLSGYSDFEYAKQAILLHTADYILKPADDEEIITCLQRVTASIHKEWEEISSRQRTINTLKENFPKLRDGLLNELLQGRSFAPAVLEQQLDSFELPFHTGDMITLMIVRMDDSFFKYNRRDFHLLEYALMNIAEEIFQDDYQLWICRDPNDYLIFLIRERHTNPSHDQSITSPRSLKLEREASELQDNVRALLHGRISIMISNKGSFPQDISKLYQSAMRMVRQRFGKNEEFLISEGSFNESLPVEYSSGLYEFPSLVQLLEAGRWEAIEEKLQVVFHAIQTANQATSQEHIMEIYYVIVSSLIHISHKNGKRLEEIIKQDFHSLLQPMPFRNIDHLQQWATRVIETIKIDMNSDQNQTSAFLVRRAQEYVEMHLSQDTSLQAIADYVFVHPVYLSRIYKAETGEGLSAYILRLKMTRAEAILLETNKKIHEIAEELGYDNTTYFIKVFKKHFGMTPKDFRDRRE